MERYAYHFYWDTSYKNEPEDFEINFLIFKMGLFLILTTLNAT